VDFINFNYVNNNTVTSFKLHFPNVETFITYLNKATTSRNKF